MRALLPAYLPFPSPRPLAEGLGVRVCSPRPAGQWGARGEIPHPWPFSLREKGVFSPRPLGEGLGVRVISPRPPVEETGVRVISPHPSATHPGVNRLAGIELNLLFQPKEES
jgi:hypothetical protein